MEKKISLYECLERIEKGNEIEKPAQKVNEGWNEWKKLNTPRFDFDGYRIILERFIKALSENRTIDKGEIGSVKFAYPQKTNNVTTYTTLGNWTAASQVTSDKAPNMCSKLIETYKSILGNKVAEIMPETIMCFNIPETSNNAANLFYKYIDTLVEKLNNNRLANIDYITVKNLLNEAKDSGYELYIKTSDFMDHFNEVYDLFTTNWLEWTKANTPHFDLEGYVGKLDRFIRIITKNELVNSGEIESIKFAYPQQMYNVASYTMIGDWTQANQITEDKVHLMCQRLIGKYEQIFGDKMAEMMPETMMSIVIPDMANETSNMFYKFIDTNVDEPNKTTMRDMKYITVKRFVKDKKMNCYELFIKTADFIENFNEIINFFD